MRKTAVLLIIFLFFLSSECFACSVVQVEASVVFNRLEGSLQQYGRVWPGGTVALYSGWNYAQGQRTGLVKRIEADGNGHFDFGGVAEGQYTMVLFDGQEFKGAHSIAVFKDEKPLHTWMMIDYKRMTPDCRDMPRWYATTFLPNKYLMERK